MKYTGSLSPKKMTQKARRAYWIYDRQKRGRRAGNNYSAREFISWWLSNLKKKKWKQPQCGRIDHSKPYSFDNIVMQELNENLKERNARCGNPGKQHRAVQSFCILTGKKLKKFRSKLEAARFYGCSDKTIYNHAMGKTKLFFKYGPKTALHFVSFRWL